MQKTRIYKQSLLKALNTRDLVDSIWNRPVGDLPEHDVRNLTL